jgi:hypothetical protein
MATWADFAAAAPDMAQLGEKQLKKFGLAYLATVRNDGSPRVSPVCPVLVSGRLYVATPEESPKLQHLLHDGRYMLHMLPGKQEEEFWVRGTADEVRDERTRSMVVEAAVGTVRIQDHEVLLEYDISAAGTTVWLDFGTPQHRASRRFWRDEYRPARRYTQK